MQSFGIVVSSEKMINGYRGLWFCRSGLYIDRYSHVIRETEEEAENDALLIAKEYSDKHKIAFIVGGYTL